MGRKLEALVGRAVALGAAQARMLATVQVVFDPRSFLKCRFGCARWGKYWTCPPHLGLGQDAFMEAFKRYESALLIQTAGPQDGQEISLAIEKEAMLQHECPFALALALCVACEACAYPEPCRHPKRARPTMDAYGVDIGKTVAAMGFEVRLDPEGKLLPAWYSMVLLD